MSPREQDQNQDWGSQVSSMMEAWAEAQRGAWRAWADLAVPSASAAGGQATPGPAGAPNMGALNETWQRMAEQTTSTWTAGADPVARDVAARIVDSQQTAMRFAGLMLQSWQDLAGMSASGGDWAGAIKRFTEQLQSATWRGPTSFGQSSEDMTDLWRMYVEGLSRMTGPWSETLKRSPGHFGEALAGDHSELLELSRLYWDAWERTGGRLFEGPSLGFSREFEERLLRGFDAWVDWRKSIFEYQVVYGKALADAVEGFVNKLHAKAEAGEPIESMGELFTMYTLETDAVLEQAFRTEEYAAVQGLMLNAAMKYRKHEREIVETFLKMTDIPARSELDEAFQAIHALRREVRELRRELVAARAVPAVPAVKATTVRATKPAAKKPATTAAKKPAAKKPATTTARKPAAKKPAAGKGSTKTGAKPRKPGGAASSKAKGGEA